jgi:hypothetical protein
LAGLSTERTEYIEVGNSESEPEPDFHGGRGNAGLETEIRVGSSSTKRRKCINVAIQNRYCKDDADIHEDTV